MRNKIYFVPKISEETAYSLNPLLKVMANEGWTEMQAFEAVRDYGSGYTYCKKFAEILETGEHCGKQCEEYSPRNGRSGCCKHVGCLYTPGKEVTITINQIKYTETK